MSYFYGILSPKTKTLTKNCTLTVLHDSIISDGQLDQVTLTLNDINLIYLPYYMVPNTFCKPVLFPLCNLKPQNGTFIIHDHTSSRVNLAAILSHAALKLN